MQIKRGIPTIILGMMATGAFLAGSTASSPDLYRNLDNHATTSSNTTVESVPEPDYYHDM